MTSNNLVYLNTFCLNLFSLLNLVFVFLVDDANIRTFSILDMFYSMNFNFTPVLLIYIKNKCYGEAGCGKL